MAVNSKHPEYESEIDNVTLCRVLYEGENAVKDCDILHLPPTSGMVMDGMGLNQPGRLAYNAYKMRAKLPDYFKEAVENSIGLMHRSSPTAQLPEFLSFLADSATQIGESLGMLLRKINAEQLIAGRLVLLPNFKKDVPYLSLYTFESVGNWNVINGELQCLILDESKHVLGSGYSWQLQKRFRVFEMVDGVLNVSVKAEDGSDIEPTFTPKFKGQVLTSIPATIINAMDLAMEVDKPPLLGLANHVIAMYRSEADYRQHLFLQSQDTLVMIGSRLQTTPLPDMDNSAVRIGAGSLIEMDLGGDAKFIGVGSTGLQEQRTALENDHVIAARKSGQLASARSNAVESGTTLQTRINSQTANLNQIALAGALGLQTAVRKLAQIMGATPQQIEEVVIEPNLEFAEQGMAADELVKLMNAKALGAPLSEQSIHDLMEIKGVTKLSYEDELEIIANEAIK